jgi:hypothetical protein
MGTTGARPIGLLPVTCQHLNQGYVAASNRAYEQLQAEFVELEELRRSVPLKSKEPLSELRSRVVRAYDGDQQRVTETLNIAEASGVIEVLGGEARLGPIFMPAFRPKA